ncbi:MAG: hypothetical protein JWO89_3790, partial [Verrucomicrobiaceae bacterium]|nr:hypothetical protein [Verrucomicrobiaceae bacterium]
MHFKANRARTCWLIVALLMFTVSGYAQILTWDKDSTATGIQNGDGVWNSTLNTNWWDGTSNTAWVNSATSIAQFGTTTTAPAASNLITVSENITLKELRFLAVTAGAIATGQQYIINGDVVGGRTLDFGSNGLIQMEDRSSGGSQFAALGGNLRLKGDNLRLQKYGAGTAFQYISLNMAQNSELTGPFTVGGSIYASLAAPNTLQNVSKIVVEAGGSVVLGGGTPNYGQAFVLAGYGNSLAFTGTSYGAIRFTSSNTTVSGGINLSSDAGVHSNFSGAFGTTGILINSAISDGGNNYGFTRFAFTRGDGTLTLAAANTYGGATTLGRALATYSGGVTILDFAASTSPQNDILYNGLAGPGNLNFIGGNSASILRLAGKDGSINSQRLGNVTVNGTHSGLELYSGAGGTVNVSLGTFTRTDPSATLSIVAPASGSVTTTQAAGFVGPWLSYTAGNGSRSWGQVAGGALGSGFRGNVSYGTGTLVSTYGAAAHLGISNVSTGGLIVGAGTTDLNTLSMADIATDRQVPLATGQTLRLGTQGGIQLVNGARGLTIGNTGVTSTLTAGGAVTNTAGQLFLSNQSATDLLTVNSNITNNTSGIVTLVVNGAPAS